MNTKFKKLALTAGITAALAGISMPTYAVIEGATGEALLVPFVLWDAGKQNNAINTVVELTVPASVGRDTIPNDNQLAHPGKGAFTASHSTYTNPGSTLTPGNSSLKPGFSPVNIHWRFFDEHSVERDSGYIPVTNDDFYVFNWGDQASSIGLDGVKGYLVFANESAENGSAATFSMFGDAYMLLPTELAGAENAFGQVKIPVLPMNDGADTQLSGEMPTVDNQVVYVDGQMTNVSPLIAGMRTNFSDKNISPKSDYTIFDLTLSSWSRPSIHVVWNDANVKTWNRVADVFDDNELTCNAPVDLTQELNVVVWQLKDSHGRSAMPILGAADSSRKPTWVNSINNLCVPNGSRAGDRPDDVKGFVRYNVPEWIDTGIDSPESSAVAFSLVLATPDQYIIDSFKPRNPDIFVTALGHERGQFK